MDITRHNYEEYFLLYVDNELSAADRRALEAFVQQNPDLEEELIMLQQSVLRPDEKVVFTRKENLMKDTTRQGMVNENNYEEYFVLYGDDELTNEEKDLVEQFVYKYPQYQAEFELIQQARLFPDNTLTFPDKAYLYRTEQDDNKVVAFGWWRIAAAAVLLIAIGSLSLYIATRDTSDSTPAVAETKPAAKDTTTIAKTDTKEDVQQPDVVQNNTVAVKEEKNINDASNIRKPVNVSHKSTQEVMIAKTETPVPENREPNEIRDSRLPAKPVEVAVASYTVKPITGIDKTPVTEPAPVAVIAAVMPEETNPDKTYVLNTSVNKTPLRGFFRKVSRVVDKATSFEPDENRKGGVRIANFELAIK